MHERAFNCSRVQEALKQIASAINTKQVWPGFLPALLLLEIAL